MTTPASTPPLPVEDGWRPARYPGRCARCTTRFGEGTLIRPFEPAGWAAACCAGQPYLVAERGPELVLPGGSLLTAIKVREVLVAGGIYRSTRLRLKVARARYDRRRRARTRRTR